MASTTEALLVVAVALLVIYVSRKVLGRQKLNLPPGPTPFPILGSLHLLGTLPHKSLADLAKKYGPLMSLQLGQKQFMVATSPEAAKQFLRVQDATFSFRPAKRAAQLALPADIVLHDVTPVMRHIRKIFVSEMTSAKRLDASKYVRTEEVAYMLHAISKSEGTPIRVNTHLHVMSSNIVSRMLLSKRFMGGSSDNDESGVATAADVHEFIAIVEDMADCFGVIHPQDFFNFVPIWFDPLGVDSRFRKLSTRMHAFYTKLVDEHKAERLKHPVSEDAKTMLDVLLEQLEDPDQQVTEDHVRCVIWDALAAGTDTTMLTSEWAMAEVLRNPAVAERARAELDRVVGRERTVREADIPELKYVQAIAKETFRLHPPVPMLVPHLTKTPAKVFGYDIPAETAVFVNAWGIARDPAVWERALEFAPERFLEGGSHAGTEFEAKDQFELIPFGSGRRSCPGMGLGIITVHLQVASLLHAFDWTFPGGMAPEKLDMAEAATFTLVKKDPLVAVATPRLPLHLY